MVEVKPTSKPRKCVKNCDLPSDVLTDKIWQRVFIPILMTWGGVQRDPWTSKEQDLSNAILAIGRRYVRPDFQLTPTGNSYSEVSRVSHFCLMYITMFVY